MTKTVLITLGRLAKALEVARALSGAGCRVIVAEPFARHVCKPSRHVAASYQVTAPNVDRRAYEVEMLGIIAREKVDIVLPVSEEALHVARFADRFPAQTRLASEGADRLHLLHDKLAFARLAADMGFAVPQTYPHDAPEVAGFIALHDYVVKPVHSCSGLGLHLCQAGDRLPDISAPAVVQRRIEGRHVSTCALVQNGTVLGNVCYEGTVLAGTVAVCFERVDDKPPIDEWVRRFAADFTYNGFLSFDFIVDDDATPWPIECNPRVTSGVHFFDPASLARAIIEPEAMQPLVVKPGRRFQQAYSTLTEVYANILRPRIYARLVRELFTARDVVWSLKDPAPFLLMTPYSWEILKPSIFGGISLGEAAMRDIAWFGEASGAAGELSDVHLAGEGGVVNAR